MTLENFIRIYIEMSLLLVLSFSLFKLCRIFFDRGHAKYQFLLRTAQILVLASLVIPIFLQFIPQRNLPVIKFRTFLAESERDLSARNRQHKNHVINNNLRHREVESVNEVQLLDRVRNSFRSNTLFSFSIFFTFLGGLFFMLFRLVRGYDSLKDLVSRATLIRKIGGVAIFVSDEITVPFSSLVAGRACVLVPIELACHHRDFKMAIFHEIQHHRNRDTTWAWMIEFFVCAFYFHPAIYFWKNEIIEVQEISCDEALLGQKRLSSFEYGSCLLKVAEAAIGSKPMQVGTTCMAQALKNKNRHKSFLRRRIEMFHSHHSKRSSLVAIAFGTLSLVLVAAVAYGTQQTLRSPERAPTVNPGQAEFNPVIQKMTEETLAKFVQKFHAKGGFVLVSDPASGRLLAVANILQNFNTDNKSWSLSYELEPASAMKGIVTAAALDRGVTRLDELHDCGNGTLEFGGRIYKDWGPFKELSTADTVVQSSNLCAIRIGAQLGAKEIAHALLQFGFGPNGSTVNFPGAKAGELPDPSMYPEDDYVAVMSAGNTAVPSFHITPLEMLQAYSAIANRGRLMKPIEARSPDSSIQLVRQVISAKSADEMKSVLQSVVLKGTGTNAKSSLYSTAGKTSTAFAPDGSAEYERMGGERGIGGFVGFAPVANPKVAIYVGIIEPTDAEDHNPHGNRHAAPVFKEVAEKTLMYLNVPPDQH